MPIYAKLVNGWPVEIRGDDWQESNHSFNSQKELDAYLSDNIASKPVMHEVPPQKEASEIWQEKLDGGWLDQLTNIKLKTNKEARDLFTGQVVMLREALDAGVLTADAELSIWDYHEQSHTLTVSQLRGLLLRYGIAWQQMFAEFAP